MPISFNNFSYGLSKVFQHIENPNYPTGVLIEEIPSDIGRTYQSYKRGGVLEAWDRFGRETLSALVWLAGIPAFNKVGNFILENFGHLPMKMDYSDETIYDTINFLKTGENPKNLDVSELTKYIGKKIKDGSVEEVAQSVKKWKGISTVSAVVLNCIMMGIVIPKFNQYLTRKRLKKRSENKTAIKSQSFDDFKKKTSKKLSFTGGIGSVAQFAKNIPYLAENNNTFRLVITDIPTLIGRAATSRNKYEALENTVIDGASIFFYNFCAHTVLKLLNKLFKNSALNPMVADKFSKMPEDVLKSALNKLETNKTVDTIFDKEFANEIYDYSSFGKYTKINRFVSKDTKNDIDNQVYSYLKKIKSELKFNPSGSIDMADFAKKVKIKNYKNAGFLAIGFMVAIYGLSTLMPRIAFKLTTLLTGKNEFTGIAHFDNKKSKNKKNIKNL